MGTEGQPSPFPADLITLFPASSCDDIRQVTQSQLSTPRSRLHGEVIQPWDISWGTE